MTPVVAVADAPAAPAASPPPPTLDGRLDFVLPDFTRLGWVSDRARETWEPRLNRITDAWFEIEWLAITSGIRSCAATIASPEDFVARAGRWAARGVSVLPVELLGVSSQPYATTSVEAQPGRPFVFRLVLGAPADVAEFQQAWEQSDQDSIGRLLGYPACCRAFFEDTWVRGSHVDTTWPMAVATSPPVAGPHGSTVAEVAGPPEANILWRWMGARAVPHLPCSFVCPETVAFGAALIAVGREAGYGQEMDWLLDVLSWPVEWSGLHGIAEIKTPVVKVSARTDATARAFVVRRDGPGYPPEGADGLGFPYRRPPALRLSDSRGFQRGLDNPLGDPVTLRPVEPGWYASDNGFSSRLAMDDAHRPIVELATAALAGGVGGAVLDLGCGNGALLKKICAGIEGAVPFGVDIDPARVEHARETLAGFAENFTAGDVSDPGGGWWDRRYDLAILMPGRLLEMAPEQAAAVRSRLADRVDRLLVYSYEDWLGEYCDLGQLAAAAGMELEAWDGGCPASLARIPTRGEGT